VELLLVLLVLVVVVGALLWRLRSRAVAKAQELQEARAEVALLHNRLGLDVETLFPGDDPVAVQALADAQERWNATGALLATADTLGDFAAARRTALEGLAASRTVRERIGLDAGPEPQAPQAVPRPTGGPLGLGNLGRQGDGRADGPRWGEGTEQPPEWPRGPFGHRRYRR
jgi:hypothetical protein